ncbi:MAG: AMP-binding protein [Burkholderiales bacterium]|nr:AMP-binding protein [Burkholderiales bacterium]
MILGRSLLRNAVLYPDRRAIISEDGAVLTHGAFADRVWRLASGLAQRGLGKNDRIAVLSQNSADYLCAYFAIGSLGAWMVPISTVLKVADVDFRMDHCEAQALLVSGRFAPLVSGLRDRVRRRLLDRIFVFDGAPAEYIAVAELLANGKPKPSDVQISPSDILYIGYTSGTTGTPKGALVSHGAIVSGFLYKALDYGVTDADVTINAGPYWHSAPRDFAALALYLGGTSVVPSGFDAEQYLELVERYRVTNSFVVPTMLQMLLASPGIEMRDISSMRCLISGGSPLPTIVKERVLSRFGTALTEFYGATETRIITSISAAELNARERSVGRPIRDVELRILDSSGNEVPRGEIGEVFVRGPGLFSGYYKDPERTRAAHRGEWFSLGDMGRRDEDGYLYLVDRKNDMIISGGENIYPNEVEEVLRRFPGVKDAAVIGLPDELWGEIVAAFVVPESDASPDSQALIEFCARHLPAYMKPRRIDFAATLPRNAVGKVLRRELREPFWKNGEARI